MTGAFRAWQDYYLLTGGTAATLTGLAFLAATLAANLLNFAKAAGGVCTFVTPTVIHFTTTLLVGILCTIPDPPIDKRHSQEYASGSQ